MKKLLVTLMFLGVFLWGGFVVGWADEKPLPSIEESWGFPTDPSPTPAVPKINPPDYFLEWVGNDGGKVSSMQDMCLQIPKNNGGSSSIELVNWDLYGGVKRLEGIYWLDESNSKFGLGFDNSTTGAVYLTVNYWTKQKFGPGFFTLFCQAKKGLSGQLLSPDIFQVNYFNFQVPVLKNVTAGPDTTAKLVEGKPPLIRLGGIVQIKAGDFLFRFREFPKTSRYPEMNQSWLFGFFRF